MWCIVCGNHMNETYEHYKTLESPMLKPVLKGYSCDFCNYMRNKSELSFYISGFGMNEYELKKFKVWQEKMEYVKWMYDQTPLPEGYSFP